MWFTLGTKGKPGRCHCDAIYQSDHLETWLNPVNPNISVCILRIVVYWPVEEGLLTGTQRYVDRGRHLEKPRKRLREERRERREDWGDERRKFFRPLPLPLLYFKPIILSLKISF